MSSASLLMTEAGPSGLNLVFNENSDKSGAMLNTIREILPGREIVHKAVGDKHFYTIESNFIPALEEEIRYNDYNGTLIAEAEIASTEFSLKFD